MKFLCYLLGSIFAHFIMMNWSLTQQIAFVGIIFVVILLLYMWWWHNF